MWLLGSVRDLFQQSVDRCQIQCPLRLRGVMQSDFNMNPLGRNRETARGKGNYQHTRAFENLLHREICVSISIHISRVRVFQLRTAGIWILFEK
jgi:hypothetical protein